MGSSPQHPLWAALQPTTRSSCRRQLSGRTWAVSLARFHVSVGFRTIQDLSGEHSGWVTKFVIDSKKLWRPVWKTIKIFSPKVSSHRNTGLNRRGLYSTSSPSQRLQTCERKGAAAGWVRRRAQEVRKGGEARTRAPRPAPLSLALSCAVKIVCPAAPAPSSLMPG